MMIDEISAGDTASKTVTIDRSLLASFGHLVDDHAPAHFDEAFAKSRGFEGQIVHGFLLASLVSGLLGQELPGADFVINEVKLKFRRPVYVGDEIICSVTVDKIVKSVDAVVLSVCVSRDLERDPCVSGSVICSAPKIL